MSLLISIRRHVKSVSSISAYPLLAFVIIAITACGGSFTYDGPSVDAGASVDAGPSVDADGDGLIEIHDAAQLNMIRMDLAGESLNGNSTGCGGGIDTAGNSITKCSGYELMADINLVAAGYNNWEPIGSCITNNICDDSFAAIFEGNNYTISNITIALSTPTNGVGFFGAISAGSQLRNVVLHNVNISLGGGGTYGDVGGLVGFAHNARIVNSSVVDTVIEGTPTTISVGGLVGDGDTTIITSSYAVVGSISNADNVGGLVGFGDRATITSSYAVVDSINGDKFVGGLVGYGRSVRIASSYAVVDSINGSDRVGGLVGDGSFGRIASNYVVVANISATGDSVGGLVGYGNDARITSNYVVVDSISATGNRVGGLVGFGRYARITSNFALTMNLTGTSDVDGLIGDIDFVHFNGTTLFAIVSSSYWLDGVSYTIGGSSATTIRSNPSRTTANSGANKTVVALRLGTDGTGNIYGADWTNAWCDPATGEFTTDSNSLLAMDPNLAWAFGNSTQYPALTCLAENISLANQRRTSANVLSGNPPLQGIDRKRL